MEADADRDEYVDPKAGRDLFGDVATRYLRLRAIGGTSRQRYESVYRNQVEPVFAGRRIKAVRPSDVLEWLRSPEMAKLGASTQGLAYLIVAGTFDLAAADGLRRDNPARSDIVPAPPKGDPPPREDGRRTGCGGSSTRTRSGTGRSRHARPPSACARARRSRSPRKTSTSTPAR